MSRSFLNHHGSEDQPSTDVLEHPTQQSACSSTNTSADRPTLSTFRMMSMQHDGSRKEIPITVWSSSTSNKKPTSAQRSSSSTVAQHAPVHAPSSSTAKRPVVKKTLPREIREAAVLLIDSHNEYEMRNAIPGACVSASEYAQLPLAEVRAVESETVPLLVRYSMARSGQRLYRLSASDKDLLINRLTLQKQRLQRAIDKIAGSPGDRFPLCIRADGAFVRGDVLEIGMQSGSSSVSDPTQAVYCYYL